jgi:hypothetical protein
MFGLTTFFFIFLGGAILIGPSANVFGTLGMPPIEAPLWTTVAK